MIEADQQALEAFLPFCQAPPGYGKIFSRARILKCPLAASEDAALLMNYDAIYEPTRNKTNQTHPRPAR